MTAWSAYPPIPCACFLHTGIISFICQIKITNKPCDKNGLYPMHTLQVHYN